MDVPAWMINRRDAPGFEKAKKSRQGCARIYFPKFGSNQAGQTSCGTKTAVTILSWFNNQNGKVVLLLNAQGVPNTLQSIRS